MPQEVGAGVAASVTDGSSWTSPPWAVSHVPPFLDRSVEAAIGGGNLSETILAKGCLSIFARPITFPLMLLHSVRGKCQACLESLQRRGILFSHACPLPGYSLKP